jgi:hypothetical protein
MLYMNACVVTAQKWVIYVGKVQDFPPSLSMIMEAIFVPGLTKHVTYTLGFHFGSQHTHINRFRGVRPGYPGVLGLPGLVYAALYIGSPGIQSKTLPIVNRDVHEFGSGRRKRAFSTSAIHKSRRLSRRKIAVDKLK